MSGKETTIDDLPKDLQTNGFIHITYYYYYLIFNKIVFVYYYYIITYYILSTNRFCQ